MRKMREKLQFCGGRYSFGESEEVTLVRKKWAAMILGGTAVMVSGGGLRAQVQPVAPVPPVQQTKPAGNCEDVATLKNTLEARNTQLRDWPNLARYREANASVVPGEARVVFMGDSITDGWVQPQYGGFFPGKPYIDRGISGQTTPQMLIRFRPDVLALKPRAVVILAGTNDLAGNTGPMTLEDIEGNLMSMAELAKANGVSVVLSSVLPVSDYNREGKSNTFQMRTSRPPAKILELNAWMKKYAADNGHVYLDYFAAMVDADGFLKRELSNDGLHPNAAGYAVMNPLAEKAIEEALKK
jgi:lysophospholipase L1-like esterase